MFQNFHNFFYIFEKDIDVVRIGRFARYFETELAPLCNFVGGAIAHEVIKQFGKFKPLTQWLHFDEQNLITDEAPTNLHPRMNTKYQFSFHLTSNKKLNKDTM